MGTLSTVISHILAAQTSVYGQCSALGHAGPRHSTHRGIQSKYDHAPLFLKAATWLITNTMPSGSWCGMRVTRTKVMGTNPAGISQTDRVPALCTGQSIVTMLKIMH